MTRPSTWFLACALVALTCMPALAQEQTDAQRARADIAATLGFVPGFLSALPDSALPGAWEMMKGFQLNDATALPAKVKELIGLAVSAQVPCKYCTYAHTEFAKLSGATRQEIAESVVLASMTRHWSTVLQGQQTDLARFKGDIARLGAHLTKSAGKASPPPVAVVDQASALREIEQSFGAVPDFMKSYPKEALAGAWKEMRDVEMSPATALPGKYKSLIGLAVASQIPCRFCLAADTQFAKLEGASDREIAEAIAMAAHTRHWSTWLNGAQIDERAFERDVDRLVRNVKKQMAAAKKGVARLPEAGPKPAATAAKAARATNPTSRMASTRPAMLAKP
jgi:AhpD family alkylhydroperoxidase